MPGEELEPIREAGEAAAALADVLIDKSGASLVPKTYLEYIAARVHFRNLPKLIERAQATAAKVKASGLPPRAYASLGDPLLTAILEGAAEEEDPDLQRVWENLLANQLVDGAPVKRSYPQILRGLEPDEVRLLDQIVPEMDDDRPVLARATFNLISDVRGSLDNLERQNLIRYTAAAQPEETYASIEESGCRRGSASFAATRLTAALSECSPMTARRPRGGRRRACR